MRLVTLSVLLGLLVSCSTDHGAAPVTGGSLSQITMPVIVPAGDIQWKDGPGSLPKGAQFAAIEGDPAKPGLFTMRLKLPGSYKIPPHFHAADEHVTVISGVFNVSLGDSFDASKLKALPAGSFGVIPPNTPHFAATNEETVVQLHGVGPWKVTYVNPADDPRKSAGTGASYKCAMSGCPKTKQAAAGGAAPN